ncbi:MAG TPA: HDOD domain-containing protein [Polyangiaceae bacterium]|jgi:putative nucleotidyltransferase with HDIG domain|nr:HDOD domain-containing protein [Polyangiaceae bacterium]
MASSPAAKNHATSGAPSVAFDEELWFGTNDGEAAETAAARSMAATAGKLLGARPFPESARKLAELSSRESTTIQEYVHVLEQDPALSAKLLKVVNSAGFSLRQRCTSVRHAVTIVGSKYLHQIATTAAVLDMFNSESAYAVSVLSHSAVMGAFCRYLGAHVGLPAEELFTIGALHDIGKLMMLDTFGEEYLSFASKAPAQADALHPLEREKYGFDHAVLAAHVLKAWHIPEPVPKIVAWHHEPARALQSSTAHATLVQTVRLADALVHALAAGAQRDQASLLAQHDAANYLDISEAQLAAMWPELSQLRLQALEQDSDDDAPESASAARIKSQPSKPSEAQLVPKQFPCVECGSASFGSTCPACGSNLCPQHPVGSSGWCARCDRSYSQFTAKTGLPLLATLLFVVGALPSLYLAWTQGPLAGLLGAVFLVFVAIIGKRSYLRTMFLRSVVKSSEP